MPLKPPGVNTARGEKATKIDTFWLELRPSPAVLHLAVPAHLTGVLIAPSFSLSRTHVTHYIYTSTHKERAREKNRKYEALVEGKRAPYALRKHVQSSSAAPN